MKENYTIQEYADLYLTMLYEQDWIICDNSINFACPFQLLLCDYSIDIRKVYIDMCISFVSDNTTCHMDIYGKPFFIGLFSEPFKFERYLSNIFIKKRLFDSSKNSQYCKNIIYKENIA